MPKTCAFIIMQHGPTTRYRGNLSVMMASPLGRLHQLEQMMVQAQTHIRARDIRTDLKVAICPEHYLSKKHSYPASDVPVELEMFHEISGIIPILQSLKRLSDRYPDWLIIPGTLTVLGLEPVKGKHATAATLTPRVPPSLTSTVSDNARLSNQSLTDYHAAQLLKMRQAPEKEFRPAYNLSPVYFNGQIVLIRRKVYESVSEGRSLDRPGEVGESTFFPFNPSQSILEMAGLKIGIEICSEHEHGYLAWQANSSLDLHIVISNEVYPFGEHAAIKDNGLFVHAGSTTTGTYRKGALPDSVASAEADYPNEKKAGVYFFLEDVG